MRGHFGGREVSTPECVAQQLLVVLIGGGGTALYADPFNLEDYIELVQFGKALANAEEDAFPEWKWKPGSRLVILMVRAAVIAEYTGPRH